MNAPKLLLRVYGERKDGQWTVMCLDFSLAAQADTLEEAQKLLSAQIVHYVKDATVGRDKEHAGELLRRRAPVKYWAKFYFLKLWQLLAHRRLGRRAADFQAMPLVPAGA